MSNNAASSTPASKRMSLLIGGAIAAVVTYLISVAVIPRWWAQRIGKLVQGRMTFGSILGVVAGLAFTALPLFVLWLGWRRRNGWKRAAGFVLGAAVLASPNLATLGIVLGNGSASHAGERILDVDGPGFRGGTLIGAILGAVLFGWIAWLAGSRRRNKRSSDEFRDELRRRNDVSK